MIRLIPVRCEDREVLCASASDSSVRKMPPKRAPFCVKLLQNVTGMTSLISQAGAAISAGVTCLELARLSIPRVGACHI
jgi:hypothetical protein